MHLHFIHGKVTVIIAFVVSTQDSYFQNLDCSENFNKRIKIRKEKQNTHSSL